jgi:hypothetical protein
LTHKQFEEQNLDLDDAQKQKPIGILIKPRLNDWFKIATGFLDRPFITKVCWLETALDSLLLK